DSKTVRLFYPVWQNSTPGDRIVVRNIDEGSLVLMARKGITIEGEAGVPAVWKAQAKFPDNAWKGLLDLRGINDQPLENIVFRGITFDGRALPTRWCRCSGAAPA